MEFSRPQAEWVAIPFSRGLSQPRDGSQVSCTAGGFLLSEPSGNLSGKGPACQCRRHKRHRFNSQVGKIPWRRKWQPTPVFFPGESHEQRSLVGYSPWVTESQTWLKQLSTSNSNFKSVGLGTKVSKLILKNEKPDKIFLACRPCGPCQNLSFHHTSILWLWHKINYRQDENKPAWLLWFQQYFIYRQAVNLWPLSQILWRPFIYILIPTEASRNPEVV